ncbi:MAG: hypothetical protein PHX43_00460 [Alphaproteobacteria bacterium]|nr:hypothetical protein [Alphaproteobacteria bacterium]
MSISLERLNLFFKAAEESSNWSDNWIVVPQHTQLSPSLLDWRSAKNELTENRRTLGDFSASLKKAGIVDVTGVDLPGCMVLLPNGTRLWQCFSGQIEKAYSDAGLEKYDYPMIAPMNNFLSAEKVIPLKEQVLYVGTDSDFASQRPRAGLCPTGEEVIYDHWRRMVKTKQDLPIEMYRQSRFYRPHTSSRGASVFRLMENADVFEFHGCFPNVPHAKKRMRDYFDMQKALSAALCLPTVFGVRPIWTNQHRVSYLTIGGDTILPVSGSIQSFSLYMQGHSFSSVLPVQYKENGKRYFTEHVTGAISRRGMFAHLLNGWNSDGSFFVHPDLVHTKCKMFYIPHGLDDEVCAKEFQSLIAEAGVSSCLEIIKDSNKIKVLAEKAKDEAVPLRIFIHGRRNHADKFKMIINRSADKAEANLFTDKLDSSIAKVITGEIDRLKDMHSNRTVEFMHKQVVHCDVLSDAVDVAQNNKCAVFPLTLSEEAVHKLESFEVGEVNSFIPKNAFPQRPSKCIVSGAPTSWFACLTKRI